MTIVDSVPVLIRENLFITLILFELIDGDGCTWEDYPLKILAETDNLSAYIHDGFWQPMDMLRDKNYLENLWDNKKAPWKCW